MLGLVTIGESPRDDIVTAMFGNTKPARVIQSGALDTLTDQEIDELFPRLGEAVLVSRLRNGREVTLAKPRLIPHVERAIDQVVDAGATVVCILCTGDFSSITKSGIRIVTPDRLVYAVVTALLPAGTLGVLMPHQDQEAMMREKWRGEARTIVTETFSPYGPLSDMVAIANQFREANVDLVVMDCMGYSRDHWHDVQSRLDVPVVLSNGLTGAILREISFTGAIHDPLQI